MKLVGVSYQTHPLVPSIGSSIQCRPDGPPSDFPPSIAASTSSLDNDMLYEPSFAMVSFTRLVMCSRTSWAPSFLKSFESCRNIFHQFIIGKCLCGLRTIMEQKGRIWGSPLQLPLNRSEKVIPSSGPDLLILVNLVMKQKKST
jgi:hypothetical protein